MMSLGTISFQFDKKKTGWSLTLDCLSHDGHYAFTRPILRGDTAFVFLGAFFVQCILILKYRIKIGHFQRER
jgi:hypothetical protein